MRELFVTRKAEPRPPAEAAPAPAPEVRAVRKCEPSSSATVHASPAEPQASLQEVAVATPVRPALWASRTLAAPAAAYAATSALAAPARASASCLGFRAHDGFAAVPVLHYVRTRTRLRSASTWSTLRSCGLSCLRVPWRSCQSAIRPSAVWVERTHTIGSELQVRFQWHARGQPGACLMMARIAHLGIARTATSLPLSTSG